MEIENAVTCQINVLNRKPHGLSDSEVEGSLIFRFLYLADPLLSVGEVRAGAKSQFQKLYNIKSPTSVVSTGFSFSRFFNDFLCEIDDDYRFGYVFSGPSKIYVAFVNSAKKRIVKPSKKEVAAVEPSEQTEDQISEAVTLETDVHQAILAPPSPILEAADKRPSPSEEEDTPRKRAKNVDLNNTESSTVAPQNTEATAGALLETPKVAKKAAPKKSPAKPKNSAMNILTQPIAPTDDSTNVAVAQVNSNIKDAAAPKKKRAPKPKSDQNPIPAQEIPSQNGAPASEPVVPTSNAEAPAVVAPSTPKVKKAKKPAGKSGQTSGQIPAAESVIATVHAVEPKAINFEPAENLDAVPVQPDAQPKKAPKKKPNNNNPKKNPNNAPKKEKKVPQPPAQ